jgi:hypothetical protein
LGQSRAIPLSRGSKGCGAEALCIGSVQARNDANLRRFAGAVACKEREPDRSYGGGAFSETSSNWRANQNKIAYSYIIEIAYDFSR